MIHGHKQFITLIATLVIVLAQFATVVHAADHLFHAEEVLCAAYNSAEHDKSLQNSAPDLVSIPVIYSNRIFLAVRTVSNSFNTGYLSRAPPQITI